jgi:hypothetical protein
MFLGKGEDIVVQQVPFVGFGTELHDKDEYAFSANCVARLTGLFFKGCTVRRSRACGRGSWDIEGSSASSTEVKSWSGLRILPSAIFVVVLATFLFNGEWCVEKPPHGHLNT